MAVLYEQPRDWIRYDLLRISNALIGAKSAVRSLTTVPYQREWVNKLQQMQLKMEVAGTSRIEGADFTEQELDAALRAELTPAQLHTRSQNQAHAAVNAYRWIALLPEDYPFSLSLICEVHSKIVTGCDDDVCPPGKVRTADHNVTFGTPRHRGATGGHPCHSAVEALVRAVQTAFSEHDPLIQAIAVHYHIAAMHPFLDGNGRTARALESFMLQKAGLRDTAFIAMSNYYYDEKATYLATLADVRSHQHDLTSFVLFALKGLELQCGRLLREIKRQMQKTLFKDTMYSLFDRLRNSRTRVIQKRQLHILQTLLEAETMMIDRLWRNTRPAYSSMSEPVMAFNRDMDSLLGLGAIFLERLEGPPPTWRVTINLEWPSEITESDFFKRLKSLPKSKSAIYLP